ncbi:hypothetical protein BC830DRAFT_1079093 [Chytriomyces sp. MP71]|nr:hypothetical protein BC830DRAFT_1079093 [Chytriomyces sp. MP71]
MPTNAAGTALSSHMGLLSTCSSMTRRFRSCNTGVPPPPDTAHLPSFSCGLAPRVVQASGMSTREPPMAELGFAWRMKGLYKWLRTLLEANRQEDDEREEEGGCVTPPVITAVGFGCAYDVWAGSGLGKQTGSDGAMTGNTIAEDGTGDEEVVGGAGADTDAVIETVEQYCVNNPALV